MVMPLIAGTAGFDPETFDPGAFDTSQVFPPTVTVGEAPVITPGGVVRRRRYYPLYQTLDQAIAPPTLGRGRVFAPYITPPESDDWVIDPALMDLVLA